MAANCQVQTPKEYVRKMLDFVGYKKHLFGKRVLENSCGEGNILEEIVKRYIEDARKNGYSDLQIEEGLERDVCAYETDSHCISICRSRLDRISLDYGLKHIRWNIINKDFLKCEPGKFQFIIGNPPYITYHDLTEEERIFLRQKYSTCKNGRFDYCYAFIQASILALDQDGKMIYLVPYSVLTNKFARDLRRFLMPHIVCVYDYQGIRIFPNALTSSVMFLCEKSRKTGKVAYYTVVKDDIEKIGRKQLSKKWDLYERRSGKEEESSFGDHFEISNSVATLCNDAFVLTEYEEEEDVYLVGHYRIERTLVKEAASTKSYNKRAVQGKEDKIIFPYCWTEEGIRHYQQAEFERMFPGTVRYLKSYRDKLEKRKADKHALWFEYGRNQAVTRVAGEKLIMPMVITKSVTVYLAPQEAVPYAGYFIKRKADSPYTLEDAREILESEAFYRYVQEYGTPTTPTSFRISVNDIKEFPIESMISQTKQR